MDTIKKFGISPEKIIEINPGECYVQNCPGYFFGKNIKIKNSPHVEFINNFINKGELWLKRNYKKTSYYNMKKSGGRVSKFPYKFIRLCKSFLKNGYLGGAYKNNYIIILNQPFILSRYNIDVPSNIPEIWSGHHRAAVLAAMNITKCKVMVGKDIMPNCCIINAKIHRLCIEFRQSRGFS